MLELDELGLDVVLVAEEVLLGLDVEVLDKELEDVETLDEVELDETLELVSAVLFQYMLVGGLRIDNICHLHVEVVVD